MGGYGDRAVIRVLVREGILDEDEQHHLRVKRAEAGDMVEIRDGSGLVGRGRLVRAGKQWSVEIEQSATVSPPPALVLGVGAGDRDRFGWLVEKAAELGVTAVIPLESTRTPGVASKLRDTQLERFRRRALDAIKQSGAAWAPAVEALTSVEEFAARPFTGWRWLADAAGGPPPAGLDAEAVTAAIGPEGGFTDVEHECLTARAFVPVALGPHILRFETAAVAAAVAVAVARRRGHGGYDG